MNDVKGYIEKLDKSMTRKEKLFFLNKVKLSSCDFIVDFGCANGRLLYEIDKRLKNKAKGLRLFGVEKNSDITIDYIFSHKFERVEKLSDLPNAEMQGKRVLLILSSVLHELDYGTLKELAEWANDYATTISIRDMRLFASDWLMRKEQRKMEIFVQNINLFLDKEQLRLFYDVFRNNVTSLYEFFLKYTYTKNWATEKEEIYLGHNVWDFGKCLRGFKSKYCKQYILPYKRKTVYHDFKYRMRAKTHVKAIFEKKKTKSVNWIKRQIRK